MFKSLLELDERDIRVYPFLKVANIVIEVPRPESNKNEEGYLEVWLARVYKDPKSGQFIEDQNIVGTHVKVEGQAFEKFTTYPMRTVSDIEDVVLRFLLDQQLVPAGIIIQEEDS